MKKSTITCDMEGVIETMNEGAEKIFGYKKEELIGIKKEFQFFLQEKLFCKMLQIGLIQPLKMEYMKERQFS